VLNKSCRREQCTISNQYGTNEKHRLWEYSRLIGMLLLMLVGKEWGVVVRNHDEDVLFTKCMVKEYITDPLIAEAVAVWVAVEFISQFGFQSVMLERDSLVVVQALCSEDKSWSQVGSLMEDAKIILCNCQFWEVCPVRRAVNEVVHRISKLALALNDTHVWEDFVPLCIREIVLAERPL
jgi:hypothetical protein